MKITFNKQKILSLAIKLLIAGAIILVDLLTKSFFQNYFANGDKTKITVIKNVLSFVYVKNTGAAFGIFENNTVALAIFSVIFLLVFIVFDIVAGKKNVWYFLGVSFIIGGAIGNLADRINPGYVRDFIYLDFMGWFPVFNIADICLTIGVICFVVYIIFYMFKEDKKKAIANNVNENQNAKTKENSININTKSKKETKNKIDKSKDNKQE